MAPILLAGWALLFETKRTMQIWAGLGNPGAQYALHRHNVGFMAVDAIAEVHRFGTWQKKFRSLVSEGWIGRNRILLLKPQTYMNDSGDAVQQALHFYKLDEEALTAFHDELDLGPFKVKVRTGGGLAGHNGLRSINASLGPDFRRVRIGIGHPGPGQKEKVTPHVLGNYAKSELEPLSDMLGAIAAEAEWLADGDVVRFMSEIAVRMQEP
jgi:PTH1 family peptidyl-tRNA hydrolase